jgi:alpha-galactosidase
MTSEYYVLHGDAFSVVLEADGPGAPLWRYFGPRLPDGVLPGLGLRETRPIPSFSLDEDMPLSVFPLFGLGGFGAPALLAHRDGQDFAHGFTSCAVEWVERGRRLRLRLEDDVAGLGVEVELAVVGGGAALEMRTALVNQGSAPLEVSWLAAAVLPLPASAERVRSYSGRHNHEFAPFEDRLSPASWVRENRRGLTSHDAFPGAVVACEGATAQAGQVFAAQLAWSGNHAQRIDRLEDGRRCWQFGEWLAPGEVRLAPGQRLTSPDVLAVCSDAGFDGAAQAMHQAIRGRMTWPGGAMAPRPVHLNTWEAVYFDHKLEDLKTLADLAAEAGVERFVLDDGWFHRRRDDRAGLGDWTPDAGNYPDGFRPLAQQVVGLGMAFGLWVEPEMVNPDSDLYRAHPDWRLHLDGRAGPTARNQLVLDLARDEVADHLFAKIGALLDALPITYLKWDHNRDLAPAAHAGRAAYRRQIEGAWRLMDRLRARWPHVEIEACAGGGGRIDAGIVRRTHRFWTSDCIDAVSRVEIQRGFLQFMPPEIMGAHIGAAPAHSTERSQALDFRAAVALPGHLGLEFDLRTLSLAERDALAAWITLYKRLRGRLHAGKVWRGEAGDGVVWQAHGDAHDLLLFAYRLAPPVDKYAPRLRLPMLNGAGPMRVRRLAQPTSHRRPRSSAPAFAAMAGEGVVLDGAWLALDGLPLPEMATEACDIFELTQERT